MSRRLDPTSWAGSTSGVCRICGEEDAGKQSYILQNDGTIFNAPCAFALLLTLNWISDAKFLVSWSEGRLQRAPRRSSGLCSPRVNCLQKIVSSVTESL
jgi:hypothetical protein